MGKGVVLVLVLGLVLTAALAWAGLHAAQKPADAGRTFHVLVYSGGCEVARYRALGSSLMVLDGGVISFVETAGGRRVRVAGTVVVEEVKQP